MKKEFSPEEKLLRLIRGSGKKTEPAPKEEKAKAESARPIEEKSAKPIEEKKELPKSEEPKIESYRMEPLRAERPEAIAGRPQEISPLKKEEKADSAPKIKTMALSLPISIKRIDTKTLNIVFAIVLAGLVSYFVYDVISPSLYKKTEIKVTPEERAGAGTAKTEEAEAPDIKPYSHYSSSIQGRNIFMPQQVEAEQVVNAGPSVDEVRSGLSLIGIIAGARPQAIIEDRKSGKSYFLYEGGAIGESKVVNITEDTVVLEYKGQRFELVL